ncbi:MAG: hypothetical protein VB096_03085 [Pseudoflavonifractor sp.]|nr:hypothetical protein [Pseudoflavonifractor sp.]
MKPFDTPEEDDFGKAFDRALRSALLGIQPHLKPRNPPTFQMVSLSPPPHRKALGSR